MSRRRAPRTTSRTTATMLAIASVVAIAASAVLPLAATAQSNGSAGDFEGPAWQLLEYRNADGKMEAVPPGIGIDLVAWAGDARGVAACGQYAARYDVTLSQVSFQQAAVDPITCDPASEAVDDAFYAALEQTSSFDITGSILTLQNAIEDDLLRLTRARIPADPTIARWELARLGSADGTIGPVIPGTQPWMEFLRGGRFVGSTGGCGSFYGTYSTFDTTIDITNVNARLRGCTEQLRAQAEAILGNIDDVTRFQVRPAGLTLEDEEGDVRLAMVPDIDLGNRTWTPIAILDRSAQVTVPQDRLDTTAIRFSGTAAGKADGRTFCGAFLGNSLVSGLALSAKVAANDGVKCPRGQKGVSPTPTEVHEGFIDAIAATASHALRGDELELYDPDGVPLMRLVPQAELIGPNWVLEAWKPKGKNKRWVLVTGDAPITAEFLDSRVARGTTGVVGPNRPNGYDAFFKTGASSIEITNVEITDSICNKPKNRNRRDCRQQATFKLYLELADTVITEADTMRLFAGTRPLLRFNRQTAEITE